MSFEYSQEISSDYEKLLENEKDCDVIIYAGENEDVKEIHAHSLILSIRSQYFSEALSNEMIEKANGKFIFKKPNISPQLFKIILRFIYCGKIDFSKLHVTEVLKLLMLVDELSIKTLTFCIQEYLIMSQEKFLQQNLLDILQTVYQHEPFTDLLNYCLEKIKIIFNSDEFISLKSPLLEFLLKHDNLNLDEVEIWEKLIKWGLAQEQQLNQDVTKWNQDDFNIFKGILYKFIPLIRFYGISSEDYYNKVKPHEGILSKELRDEILKFHMVPGYIPKLNLSPRRYFDSILVNQKHIALFTNWIDRKEENTKNSIIPSYRFNLLYRASRDGDRAAAFHEKCDNKGATIVIAKIKSSEQILGGYNPLFWDKSDSYKSTKDSFIFSFTNRNNLQTAKVGFCNNDQYSIYCYQDYGPAFGGGHDLYQHNGNWKSYVNLFSYSKIDIPEDSYLDGNYRVLNGEDYEVFQIVKK